MKIIRLRDNLDTIGSYRDVVEHIVITN